MPPFRRKTLVLIGAQGVGRRSLKNKLIMWDPDRYGTTVPCECGPGPAGRGAARCPSAERASAWVSSQVVLWGKCGGAPSGGDGGTAGWRRFGRLWPGWAGRLSSHGSLAKNPAGNPCETATCGDRTSRGGESFWFLEAGT